MQLPTTIDGVLAELDHIIDVSVVENSSMAIFAYVYRRTTAEIKKNVLAGVFEDNERMVKFDVRFANYYIEAWHNYRNNKPISASWKVAFEASKDPLCIVQYIMLGMNAHINLDLGVTAATEAEHTSLVDLKTDFMRVNTILFSLTHEMQSNLGKASRLFFLVSWLGRRNDELLINFSIKKARDFSWVTANRIWNAHGSHEKESVRLTTDKAVGFIGGELRRPKGWMLRNTVRLVRRFEEKDVAKIIDILKNG
ncbi:MAG TPA: DUF5995 family protein [Fluviicola sp.]|nr:DUF5995 family protein [Fluviicola sp.]